MSSPTADLPGRDLPGLAAEDIERRRRLLRQWRRHSLLIAILRKLLPAACVAIIAALGAWSALSTFLWRQEAKVRSNGEIRAVNPKFQGTTEQGKPFFMSAASAVRDNLDPNKETFERPVLTIGVGTPTWTKVSAVHGVYREDTHMLDLRGQVVLDDYKGNHLNTEHALVDTLKNNIDGDTRITGHGPMGSIDAQTYALRNGGDYLEFHGRVKSVIQQSPRPPAASAGK